MGAWAAITGMAVFILAAAVLLSGCIGESYSEDRNGTTIAVKPGDAIRISLSETPSTGYVWNVTLTGDLEITKTEFSSLGALTGMPGGDSGTRKWYLIPGNAPVQKFTALKMRSVDDPSRAVDRFEMTFVPTWG